MICNLFEDYLYRSSVIKMKLLILTLFFSIGFAATWKVLVDEKYDPLTHCEGTGDSVT